MNAALSVKQLEAAGFRLSINGDKLHVEPVPAPDLLERMRAAKPALLAELRLEAIATEACRGLTAYLTGEQLLAKCAPEDITEIERATDQLPFLRAFATAVAWSAMRRQGIAPPGWDKAATCKLCGPVLLWGNLTVAGCPWCWNRVHKVKIPRPTAKTTSPIGAGSTISGEAKPRHGDKSA